MKNLNGDDLVDAWSKDQLPPPVVGRSKAAAAKAAKAAKAEAKAEAEAAEAKAEAKAAEFRASSRARSARKEALKIESLTLLLEALRACQPLGIAAIAAKTTSIAGTVARAEKRANALLDVELGLMAQISGARMPEELKALEAKLAVVRKESAKTVVVDSYDTTESFETRKGVSKTYER
jgi:uncharacterized membrane protein YqiK